VIKIDVSTANLELPYSPDPDPLNRPWFQVGYVCSGTGANPGDGVPHIMFDFNTVMVYFTGSNANRYSWFTYNGVGYYGLRYPDANPITWAQWEMEAVVNYYNGTSPFINSLTQLNDTWTTSGFKSVGAELVDMDGTITTALLYFQKNAGTPDSVTASSITLDMYYFDIPGTYTAGDSITYWVKVRDNEGKSIIGSRKYFKVFAPMNADSPILVVFNGLTSSESDLALFWEPLLNNVVVDSLGMTYEYWDIEKHNGIDASIINYPSFKHALVFGYGVNNVPVTNYSGTEWGDFVSAGKNIMLASADYLYANGFSGNLTFGSGEFINDVFGVGHAESDPNDGVNSTGDEFIIGVASDPISGPWAGVPIILNFSAVLGGSNWGDFARADTANLAKAETIFTGVASDSGNGVRNISGYGGAGVYLPFCFSAIADTTPTGDPVVQDAAKSLLLRILEWFESVTSIDGNMTTQINNYELKANYPNPFNPGTTIEYTLKERSQVSLVIYNALGERVRTLVNDVQAADKYQVRWDGRNEQGIHVASGIYIYKLTAGDFVSARKMILMK